MEPAQPRGWDSALQHTLLHALPYAASLLDEKGSVLAVNRAWLSLRDQGGELGRLCAPAGESYVAALGGPQRGPWGELGWGVTEVLAGRRPSYQQVHRFYSPTEERWFRLSVERVAGQPDQVLVLHVDATEEYQAQARLGLAATVSAALSARLDMLAASRVLAMSLCERLEWDFFGIWTLELGSWTMRCVDTWVRPDLDAATFDAASRGAALGPGCGLPGRAWSSAKVQWATDLDLDPSVSLPAGEVPQTIMPPAAIELGFRTALSFPLKCGDDVLAVVDVFSRVRRAPDPKLMALLDAAGDQLALWELRERAEQCARVAQYDADEARAQLEAVIACAPAYVVNIDREGTIRFLNRAADGSDPGQIIGRHWRQYVLPEHQPRVEAALRAVLSTGEPQIYEICIAASHGKQAWLANYMGPLRSGSEITGAVVVSQDITESKRVQSDLLASQRLAAVGTLAAGIAHEINTPIQFVSDSVHFLRDASTDLLSLVGTLRSLRDQVAACSQSGPLKLALDACYAAEDAADLEYLLENIPKAIERSLDGLGRVASIVRSMKEFAHPASESMAAADLNRAIQATLTVARNEYKYVAELETELSDLPPVVCHINDINQVVLNIVVNAAHAIGDVVKESGQKGKICVRSRVVDEAAVEIEISDTGAGIPEAIRERVFDPFFTTKEVGKGTGQGLAMAWTSIRDKHGGEIWFDSKLGQGTTFHVRLPVRGKGAS